MAIDDGGVYSPLLSEDILALAFYVPLWMTDLYRKTRTRTRRWLVPIRKEVDSLSLYVLVANSLVTISICKLLHLHALKSPRGKFFHGLTLFHFYC